MSVRKALRQLKTSEAWVVSVVEIAAIEGVGLGRRDNGTVTVTLRPPTPSAEPILPEMRGLIW